MEIKPVRFITREAFERFGTVIELSPGNMDGWEIVAEEPANGWRIAVLEFSRRNALRLENHSSSRESFEPLKGVSILLAAEYKTPECFEAYLLDRPVCLKKGIWHEVLSLSEVSQVKITENLAVDCEYYDLPHGTTVGLIY